MFFPLDPARAGEELKLFMRPPKNGQRRSSENILKQAGVNPAEVRMEAKVAIVEIGKAWMTSHQARADAASYEEDRGCTAMIRA